MARMNGDTIRSKKLDRDPFVRTRRRNPQHCAPAAFYLYRETTFCSANWRSSSARFRRAAK